MANWNARFARTLRLPHRSVSPDTALSLTADRCEPVKTSRDATGAHHPKSQSPYRSVHPPLRTVQTPGKRARSPGILNLCAIDLQIIAWLALGAPLEFPAGLDTIERMFAVAVPGCAPISRVRCAMVCAPAYRAHPILRREAGDPGLLGEDR